MVLVPASASHCAASVRTGVKFLHMLTSKASTHLKTNPRVIYRPNELLYHKWGLWQRGRGHRLATVVLGTAVGVSSAALIQSLHTGTFAAMPLKVDLNSAEGDWKASKDFLLSLEDKRPYYRTSKYVPLDDIPVWTPAAGAEQSKYPRNPKLDRKISVFSGDITTLEIDAVVNADVTDKARILPPPEEDDKVWDRVLNSDRRHSIVDGRDSTNTNPDTIECKCIIQSGGMETSNQQLPRCHVAWPSDRQNKGKGAHPPQTDLYDDVRSFAQFQLYQSNNSLLGGGGVDGAIHRASGPLLKKECASLNGCETGQAKITCAYGLPAKYVVHTVGPIAQGRVTAAEQGALRSCYKNSLQTATSSGARSVAFPCISTGIYGYPPEQAVHEALATVRDFLDEHHEKLDRIIFCVFLPADKDLYLDNLPLYFPADAAVRSKL